MKNSLNLFLTLTLLMVLSIPSFSQDTKFLVTVKGGFSYSDLRTGNDLVNKSYDPILRPTICIDFNYSINWFLTFSTGINYRQKGFESNFLFTDANGNILKNSKLFFQHNQLTFPLRLELKHGNKLRFNFGIGPVLGLQLNSIVDAGKNTPVEGQLGPVDISDEYKPLDLGLSTRIGLQYPVSDQFTLAFSITDEYGLSDISDNKSLNWGEIKTHLIAAELGLGYSF